MSVSGGNRRPDTVHWFFQPLDESFHSAQLCLKQIPVNLASTDEQSKILVGISSCLIGEKVRFDGGHKQNRYVLDTLGQYFRYRPFCPEMAIGLAYRAKPCAWLRLTAKPRRSVTNIPT